MINFKSLSNDAPYVLFKEKYDDAINANQNLIEAISIASYNQSVNEVDSRYINLKFIQNDEFIFFSNYNSPKSKAFISHDQISALIYWESINVQIRIKANIKKTSYEFNQKYFFNRAKEKNALAISSRQSEKISSYEDVVKNYKKSYKEDNCSQCPKYWGGFSFRPYYFEFWEGHESRVNKRVTYKKINTNWEKFIIQP
jgi:pyridoxamine 5'-phosphate oxidase